MNDFKTEQQRISSSIEGLIISAKLLQLSTLVQALSVCQAIVVDEALLVQLSSATTKAKQ